MAPIDRVREPSRSPTRARTFVLEVDGRDRREAVALVTETKGAPVDREGVQMNAKVGDRIVVRGHRVGEHERDGEIQEVRGKDGGPPYLVKWSDGHVGMLFPGSDVTIEHFDSHHSRGAQAL
jgi:hypothetical protein